MKKEKVMARITPPILSDGSFLPMDDEYFGQGGSYVVAADGTRTLIDRGGHEAVRPSRRGFGEPSAAPEAEPAPVEPTEPEFIP
jgi:hypothetical protein